ncbi:hypothetical protein [Fusobacterium sp.]|uniref:hypothetical protein n=1 Tax=Fusobacterium sp. TaxID=68766 RepID=UPI00261902DA|nr:hypothetical protein [Fusobacterium sp.]
MKNLEEIMIGISEFKKNVSEIINNKMTRIIMKNNKPMSIIMPYEEYNFLKNNKNIGNLGQDITLDNGVQMKIEINRTNEKSDNRIEIEVYIKMKTSNEYKLYSTQILTCPRIESTYTQDELIKKQIENM